MNEKKININPNIWAWMEIKLETLNTPRTIGRIPLRVNPILLKIEAKNILAKYSRHFRCSCPGCIYYKNYNCDSDELSTTRTTITSISEIQDIYWFAYFGENPTKIPFKRSENEIAQREEWKLSICRESFLSHKVIQPWLDFFKGLSEKKVKEFILDISWGESNAELKEIQRAVKKIGWFDEWSKKEFLKETQVQEIQHSAKINYVEFDKVANRILGNKIEQVISLLGIGTTSNELNKEKTTEISDLIADRSCGKENVV